jgi:ATP diphosphatase
MTIKTPDAGRIVELLNIMRALRTPVTGCPWDLEQTFATIAPYTIEEAYEVADAIERGDMADLKDELGDLLLQVVYHARMAEEAGAFAFPDVVAAVSDKMIRRHPHVFGDAEARAAGAAKGFWNRIKAEERALKDAERQRQRHVADAATTPMAASPSPASPVSLLDDVPLAHPALMRAAKLQDKAAGVGFDWPHLGPVFDKLTEEIGELSEVALVADPRAAAPSPEVPDPSRQDRIEEELGDVLFVLANVARHLHIDPENALRRANAKFVRRFRHIENRLMEMGKTPEQSTLAEMDGLWDEAKAAERAKKP